MSIPALDYLHLYLNVFTLSITNRTDLLSDHGHATVLSITTCHNITSCNKLNKGHTPAVQPDTEETINNV